MKRILIIFALFVAITVPAQTAQANSFTTSNGLLSQLKGITGSDATNLFGFLPQMSEAFDIAVLYSSSNDDPFVGAGSTVGGINVLLGAMVNNFFGTVTEVASSYGSTVVYEYNGGTVEFTGGTIFVSASINSIGYVFALSPSSQGKFNSVPLPAAALFFGSGLMGIIALRRKMN